jgi:hypothetical protein
VSTVRGAGCWGIVPLDWGCQLGMRLGGTIIVERRLVNIVVEVVDGKADSIANLYIQRSMYV